VGGGWVVEGWIVCGVGFGKVGWGREVCGTSDVQVGSCLSKAQQLPLPQERTRVRAANAVKWS
jgi:hypothetical protein